MRRDDQIAQLCPRMLHRPSRMLPCHQPIPPMPLPLLPHQHQPQSLHRLHPLRHPLRRWDPFPQIPRLPPPAPVERFRQPNPARRLQHPQGFHAACLLQATPGIPKTERLADPATGRRAAGEGLRRHQGRHPRRSRLRGQGFENAVLLVHAQVMPCA